MANTQYNGRSPLESKFVYYEGTEQPPIGGLVCYKVDAPIPAEAHASFPSRNVMATQREFNEQVLGTWVEKPATVNLNFFAGIVKSGKIQKKANASGVFIMQLEIIEPTSRETMPIRTKADLSLGEAVGPVDGEWWAVAKTNIEALDAIALSFETINTTAITEGFPSFVQFRS